MNTEQNFQLNDISGMIRRRGRRMAIVAGVAILASYWVVMALPNLYTSSAVILVEPQSVDEGLVDSGIREVDLSERLGLMTAEILSRSRLSKIIDEVGLYKSESRSKERLEVVEMMKRFVSVRPVLNEMQQDRGRRRDQSFNTFRINFQNENPVIAREVASRIANDFINANISTRTETTSKSLEFMEDEMASLSGELEQVEKAISEVKAQNPGRLPDDVSSNQRILQFATDDLRDAQRILDAAQSDAAFWKNQAIASATAGSESDGASPAYRKRALELELNALLARGYTEKHPDVVRLRTETALLEEQIQALASSSSEGTRSLPEQNARAEQRRAEQRVQAATEDIDRLRVTIAEIEARLAATPAVAERLDALDRRYASLASSYQDYGRRLQQAGVQADLERRQLGERFRILEQAEVPPRPSSPNRMLMLLLGTVLGIGLAIGVGLASELSDTSLHQASDLQTALGVPVLAAVPEIVLESDRIQRSRRVVREGLLAAGVVGFSLLGGLATYLVVNGSPGGPGLPAQAPIEDDRGGPSGLQGDAAPNADAS